ncbi:Primase C-terminal domain-like protein [Candidatus Megaera venefica]|uniref:Primase C-terminal domain-like protein n=1 Tax=Candidatus Megaera venefica TaxID=2055910 RepID=A0ABU5NE84_9RICK|nr:PriCT-2 domain-containing protein [Candidatus Megaera venefica]MEA0971474.1 Primase C-terminal domain-like protein [Candidatus Megaera venefica]
MNNISQISNEDLELNQANACEAITQEQAIIQPTQLQSIKISRCTNKEDNRPVSEELTWEELKSLLTTFNETIISKGNAPAFIGGYFDGKGRKYKNLLSRTLITIDIDKYNASISDLEAFIDGSLNKYRYIAHSTSRHSETDARIRIILFPNKEIRPSDYQNVVTNFMSIYFLTKIADIPSSTAAAQLMYLPIRTSKEYLPWYKVNDGLEVDIDSFTKAAVLNEALSAANDDNFRPILTKPRCNLSDDEVIDCLTRYDVSGTDFTMWRDVGFALHHQYCGSDKGRELFVDWSLEDTREEYKHTKPVRKNAERQYDSCDNTKGDQITFATIMYRVNELENKARKKDIEKQINELPSSSSEKDIEKIINILASHYSINEAECYLQQIKKNTKWQISSLRNSFQEQQNKLQLSKINEDKLPYYPLDKPLPRAIFVEDKQFKKLPLS